MNYSGQTGTFGFWAWYRDLLQLHAIFNHRINPAGQKGTPPSKTFGFIKVRRQANFNLGLRPLPEGGSRQVVRQRARLSKKNESWSRAPFLTARP